MLGRVPGGGEGAQAQAPQVELVAVVESARRELEPCRGRCYDLGAAGGKLAAAGDEICVQVRLHRERHRQPSALRFGQVEGRVAARVHDERTTVIEVEEI